MPLANSCLDGNSSSAAARLETVRLAVVTMASRDLLEPCLVALKMLKFGFLRSEPFDAAHPDRPFPEQVQFPTAPFPPEVKARLLLCRVVSLVPMKLKNDMWNADVDFDLTGGASRNPRSTS